MKAAQVNRAVTGAPCRALSKAAPQPSKFVKFTARATAMALQAVDVRAPRGVAAAAGSNGSTRASGSSDGKKTVIITGTSSGLGLHAAKHLAASGDWHIIMANRDMAKTLIKAQQQGIDRSAFTYIQCDLASLESVRKFVSEFRATGRTLDALVCNAAIYLPVDPEPSFTVEGYELSVGVNHLSHFLLANMLMPDLKKSDWKRMVIIGSITGNTNTIAGNIPPQADLGNLEGMAAGFKYPNVMINGGSWEAPKAYKDAKVCNMLTMREFHNRFHDESGITFSSLYPGCIAETGLFRNHVSAFRYLFPLFQKNITKGYVSEDEAGRRLASVVSDPSYSQSGVYWSWSDNSEAFINTPSDEVQDDAKGKRMWELSEKLVGLESKVPAMA